MRRIKLTLHYNGTPFFGFQRIQEGPSVQQSLEIALSTITQQPILTKVAGRTDKGVHARGQVVHFDDPTALPLIKFLDGVNHYCHPHIIVEKVEVVADDFHARHSATARTYQYVIAHNQRWLAPDLHQRAGHVRAQLDVTAMQAALAQFPLGEIDCTSFRSSECQSSTPMVNLLALDLTENSATQLTLTITANHFLHNMIRIFTGTLLEVGKGAQPPAYLTETLAAKNRQQAGATFSPSGLYLQHITYPPHKVLECCPE